MLHHYDVSQITSEPVVVALRQIALAHDVGRRTLEEHRVAVGVHPAWVIKYSFYSSVIIRTCPCL